MFSRWINARLKAAENALHEGRIDEAFERARQFEGEKNTRAQKLLDAVGAALLARARLQAQAGEDRRALADLGHLRQIGRLNAEAEEFEDRIRRRLERRRRNARDEQARARRARRDIEAGHLETGRLGLEQVGDREQRDPLADELDMRVRRVGQLLEQARQALDAGDVFAACRLWQEANERHGRTDASDRLLSDLAAACGRELDAALATGRLARFEAILAVARPLMPRAAALAEYDDVGRLIRAGAQALGRGDFERMRERLLRLRAVCPGVTWIETTLRVLDEIARLRGELLSSPLGGVDASVDKTGGIGTASATLSAHTMGKKPGPAETRVAAATTVRLDRPLLMLIDGTGSSLLLTQDRVRIGRAGGHERADVPMLADILSHHADIVRDGEDYFLVAHGPVRVNQRAAERVLLRHGDRITLGATARMTFHQPSAKSGTAVLKLSSRSRLPQDVSSVVLFRETCLLGPQAVCHLRTREGDTRLVLFERFGELFVRRAGRDGRPTGPAEPLPLDVSHEIGDLRLTVKEYDDRIGAGA